MRMWSLWDVETETFIRSLDSIKDALFAPDRSEILTVADESGGFAMELHEPVTGETLTTFESPNAEINSVAFTFGRSHTPGGNGGWPLDPL